MLYICIRKHLNNTNKLITNDLSYTEWNAMSNKTSMEENLGKGIYHQIRESKITYSSEHITLEDIKEGLEILRKVEIERRKELTKQQKETSKHLTKRSKELGKEIPIELLFMTDPFLNRGTRVSKEFMIRYKEWF